MNASKPLMRLRNLLATEMTADYGGLGIENPDAVFVRTGRSSLIRAAVDTSPRSKDGTHPSRISSVRNVITPMESGGGRYTGKPTATAADFSNGEGMVQEANAGSRKATGIHNRPDRTT